MRLKNQLRKLMALCLLAAGAGSAMAQDVITASHDGTYRTDNSSVTYDLAATSQIEVKYETDKSFYGLLSFEIPAKTGYRVKTATLRLVSKKISGNRQTNIYKLGTDISSKPSYADLSSYVTSALASTYIGTVKAEGQSGKQISSDAVDNDNYKTIAPWQNSIDLDASGISVGSTLSLLIATSTDGQNSNSNANRFFGKNAEGFTNTNISLTCASSDLVPQLSVTYEEDTDSKTDVITPKVDTYLRKGNTADHGSETTMELQTSASAGTDFVGYMSFDYSVPSGMELQSATLRVVSAQIKGDRTLNFYSFASDVPGNATYATYADAITAAKATTAVGTVELEGQSGKSVASDNIDTEKYQTISAWQNTVDLTAFVKTQTGAFGLLLARDDANNSNKIFTSEATGINNSNCSYFNSSTANDLVPQLTLVFKKSDGTDPTPTETNLAVKDDSKTSNGDKDYTEGYTLTGYDNTITVVVTKTAYTDGATVAAHGAIEVKAVKDDDDKVTVTLTAKPEDEKHAIDGTPIVEVMASTSDGDQSSLSLTRRKAGESSTPGVAEYVKVTANEDGTFCFEMPSGDVTVTAKFKRLPDKPVAVPTIAYDEANNKVTVTKTEADADHAAISKMYYTTDGSDPRTSGEGATRQEVPENGVVEVTAGVTQIKVVAVDAEGHFSDVVEQAVARVSYFNVPKEWTAFYSPITFSVPEGLEAYTISSVTRKDGESGEVVLKQQNYVKTNTPMLIKNTKIGTDATATRFRIAQVDDATVTAFATDDMCAEFKGTATATTLANDGSIYYVLKDGNFLRANAGNVSAYNCYLQFSATSEAAGARRFSIAFGGDTTGIDTIGTATLDDAAWYNLNGVRMAQPTQKGIYIHQGRKIVVK